MFKKLSLKLKNETNILPFQNDLYKTLDGFGYEWKKVGTDIVLNLDKKTPLSDNVVRFIEGFVSPLSNQGLEKQRRFNRKVKNIESMITPLKISSYREIFADILLISIFSLILYHLIFVTFTILGVAIDLLAIAIIIRSFLLSINEVLMSDQTLLNRKFGFTKTDMGFATSGYNILKLLKSYKYRLILSSAVLLTLSFLSFTNPNPPLLYVTSVINFMGLLLASLQMTLQYYLNKKKHRNIKNLKPTLLAVALIYLFLIIYVMSYFIDFSVLVTFSTFIMDIIVIWAIPMFILDLIRINKFRKWFDSIHSIS